MVMFGLNWNLMAMCVLSCVYINEAARLEDDGNARAMRIAMEARQLQWKRVNAPYKHFSEQTCFFSMKCEISDVDVYIVAIKR